MISWHSAPGRGAAARAASGSTRSPSTATLTPKVRTRWLAALFHRKLCDPQPCLLRHSSRAARWTRSPQVSCVQSETSSCCVYGQAEKKCRGRERGTCQAWRYMVRSVRGMACRACRKLRGSPRCRDPSTAYSATLNRAMSRNAAATSPGWLQTRQLPQHAWRTAPVWHQTPKWALHAAPLRSACRLYRCSVQTVRTRDRLKTRRCREAESAEAPSVQSVPR